jgi:hypothetical protein
VPAETYGERGTTKIYIVGRETDGLVHTLPWYSSQIYLSCIVGRLGQKYGISVVQMGPWARGQEANADTLAIAFYFDGKLVKRYSTLDIAGSPKKVSPSVSHYEVFQAIRGFRRIESNFSVFEVWTADKRLLSFDPTTGEILKPEELEK